MALGVCASIGCTGKTAREEQIDSVANDSDSVIVIEDSLLVDTFAVDSLA